MLDHKRLRTPADVEAAVAHARARSACVVVTDAALIEMTKSAEGESTLRRTLAPLGLHRDVAAVSLCVSDLLEAEREGVPVVDVIDPELVAPFRGMLADLHVGGGVALELVNTNMSVARTYAKSAYLDPGDNRRVVVDLHKAWSGALSAEKLKQLRRHDPSVRHGCLVDPELLASLAGFLNERVGLSDDAALGLVTRRSAYLVYWLTRCALALDWLEHGGIDSGTNDARFTNDLMDVEQITIGLLAGGLWTNDIKARRLHAAVDAAVVEITGDAPTDLPRGFV